MHGTHRDNHETENVDTKPTEPILAEKTINREGVQGRKSPRNQGPRARKA
jgi:hypothetical protein